MPGLQHNLKQVNTDSSELSSIGHAQRRDFITEKTVDSGISLQSSLGTLCAIEYMKSEGVPGSVTQRVLSQPAQRRLRS
ncbi:hypothetical protein QN372_19445 [Undibacterium sp. RTI2.1]|uniref:hypothetical protein n=1 Tax=unclassified Undibacterium TaxID=2630295 RepID=UPI002AB3E660|nr:MULTISPECIES: hypothetical protein [unclassified Undibacterium]MDY7537362.1 hypothetical protein [Undibacterium sp. 5I1]MEB0032928.1 hypothetical protein [Undibacterium sp. RTI2.1]MEB0118828.1 hypothetical protein [Undibacterium sp. RTI2.2]MEB0232988.1 hypothetical protein [Undibacterium sp. 10I3]MEB0259760.1 hypothetical protein [Undibacterium sp. 5I1]